MAQLYEFDRMMVLHNQIAKTPIDSDFIEDIVARSLTGLDDEFVESVGSNAKGLPVIEYFIFDAAGDNEAVLARLTTEPSRLEYLGGAADNLHSKAQAVQAYWLPAGNDYANTFINADGGGEVFNSALSLLNNQMVGMLEMAIREKLGRPLGTADGNGPQPELVEAGLSGNSLAHIRRNVESVEQAYSGSSGLGLDDYLDYLDADYNGEPLSQAIAAQFAASYAALDAIEPPLSMVVNQNPATVQTAYDELRQLLILIKVDMANQLGVTITFNDSDGD
jgi:predicted lipoprotein